MNPKKPSPQEIVSQPEPAEPPAQARTRSGAGHRSPVAVLVVHGMGQQVPFETAELAYKGLRLEEMRQKGNPTNPTVKLNPTPETIVSEGKRIRRLEIELWDKDSNIRPVHIYEGYWAPHTEGATGIMDVVGFLLSGGWNGLRNAFSDRKRWVFREEHSVQGRKTWPQLLVALAVVISLIAVDALVLAAAGSEAAGASWPESWSRSDLLWVVALFLGGPILLFGLFHWMGTWGRPRWRSRLFRAKVGPPPNSKPSPWFRLLDWLGWWTFRLAVLATILAPLAFAVLVVLRSAGVDFIGSLGWPSVPGWMVFPFLGALAILSLKVRTALVQSVGDVAAYVQTHKLDRFNQVRDEIKASVGAVARAIYDQRNGKGFLYEGVYVVGHSLGSVVAYSTLNDLLTDDQDAPAVEKRHVKQRTKLFLTFGSPLDKTAFVFATQRRKTTWAREALAARVQPLIYDFTFREFDWVNISSPRDIISGRLDGYDWKPGKDRWGRPLPPPPKTYRPIENLQDPNARTPILAHNEYWHNPLLWWELRRRLVM